MVFYSKKKNKVLLKRIIKKIIFKFLLPVGFFFFVSVFLLNLNFFNIKKVKISGISFVSESKIQNIVDNELKGKYFNIYNKDNFIIFPKNKIEEKIKKEEKMVYGVDISYIDFMRNLEIKVEERNPEYLFCESVSNCFFMEDDGYIFDYFSKNKTKKEKKDFIVFEGKKRDKLYFLSSVEMEDVNYLVQEIKKNGLKIISIQKKDGLFIFKINGGTKIIFLRKQKVSKIFETIQKLLIKKDFEIDKKEKRFLKDIVYINLSYDQRIFYCMKGDVCENNY